jgi:hypothetical protein
MNLVVFIDANYNMQMLQTADRGSFCSIWMEIANRQEAAPLVLKTLNS